MGATTPKIESLGWPFNNGHSEDRLYLGYFEVRLTVFSQCFLQNVALLCTHKHKTYRIDLSSCAKCQDSNHVMFVKICVCLEHQQEDVTR